MSLIFRWRRCSARGYDVTHRVHFGMGSYGGFDRERITVPWVRVAVLGFVLWTAAMALKAQEPLRVLLTPEPAGAALRRECSAMVENPPEDVAQIQRLSEQCFMAPPNSNEVYEFDMAQGRALARAKPVVEAWLVGLALIPLITLAARWVVTGFRKAKA